jgi:hypothetical protein
MNVLKRFGMGCAVLVSTAVCGLAQTQTAPIVNALGQGGAGSTQPFDLQSTALNGALSTNNICSVNSTSNYLGSGVVGFCSDVQQLGVELQAWTGTGTALTTTNGNLRFRFCQSLDGSTFETTPSVTYYLPLLGLTNSVLLTNFTSYSCGQLALYDIQVTNAWTSSYATNISVRFGHKIPSISKNGS